MLPIFLSEKGWNTLVCPVCERELLPAFEGPAGLEVAYWHDFDPGLARDGLLVCGDFHCDYQEPVTFATNRVDAVPLSLSQTLSLFEMEHGIWFSAAEAEALAGEIEQEYMSTNRAKLRCAVEYFRQMVTDRLDRVNEWLSAAGKEYTVSFQSPAGEHQGRIAGHNEETILLQAGDGQVVSIRKADVSQERILYPPKRRAKERRRENGAQRPIFWLENHFYMVVEGHHLRYGERQEDGRYSATTVDAEAAQALGMARVSDELWRGYFDRAEVQRFYFRHNQVKVAGFWLEETGRSDSAQLVEVQTADPSVAQELDLEPIYALVYHEFGTQEGDVTGYIGTFPISAVEATSWYEEVQPLPEESAEP